MAIKDIQNATILLVDDQPKTVSALCEYLRLCGFTATIVENGESALKSVGERKPDIIILDVLMPGMDGFETCRQLKEHEDTRGIPVIFVSAYTEIIDKLKGFEVGGVDYVAKPFEHGEVLARIAAHLRVRNLQKNLQENNVRLQQEIEQRIQVEEALRESREQFKTIFENAPVMINSYDKTGKSQLWNKECERRLGYTKEEILAYHDPLSLLYPDTSIRDQVMADIFEADGVFREYNVTGKDGTNLIQLWANFRLPGSVIICVGHDITERKLTEETLRESQQYTRNIIESSLDMIIAVDKERRIVEFNRAAEETFGYRKEELVGKNISILYAEQDEFFEIHQVMLTEKQFIQEVFNTRKNGEVFPCLVSASILYDTQNEPIGYMGISRDITELKHAQAKLLAAHEELKEKNEELRQLNASKDKFFSIISHDLKNSFGTLLGFAELITENIEYYSKDKTKTFVSRIHSSAENLYALLENLLTWSRIQRGVMACLPELRELSVIVNRNINLFAPEAERKQIVLQSSIQEKTFVYADYSMVDTVIRNLISNALKFTSGGGSVSITSADHDDLYREISVSDTGIGIPEEVLPKLLRIDTHYTHTGTAGEKGTGLGLILCKELVEQNGGSLWVKSVVGKGTTFTFTLPKQRPETFEK